MADIAILVAEEYERRIKINSSCPIKPHHQDQEHEGGGGLMLINMGFVSGYAADPGERAQGLLASGEMKRRMEGVGKWVSELQEPRSSVGVAASHGFFSA